MHEKIHWFGGGVFDAWWIPLTVSTEQIRRFLPRSLGLSPASDSREHTVLVTVGRQREVSPDSSLMAKGFGFPWHYGESFLVIPDLVIHERVPAGWAQVLVNHLCPILLDSRRALLTGVWGYGFRKRLARFDFGDGSFEITQSSPEGPRPLLSGISADGAAAAVPPPSGVGAFGSWGSSSASFPCFTEVERMLAQPCVTGSPFGPRLVTRIDWGGASALVQPAAVDVRCHEPMACPASPLNAGSWKVPALQADRLGAARVMRRWKISYPQVLSPAWMAQAYRPETA